MSLMDDLLKLFRVDSQVRGLRSRLEGAQRFLRAQQNKLDEVLEQKTEHESRRKQHQARIANLENEINILTERIEKHREELNVASTNKEYTALLTEINTIKAERSELESQVLAEMEHVERINDELKAIDEEVRERTRKRDQARKDLEQRTEDVSERLSELESERAVAASNIPPAELEAFNDLAETYEGEAMAAIEMIDKRRREYACTACNMHVPFELVSRLLGKSDELVYCNVCRRILYIQEETRGALARK